jgi:DNA-binding NarL/FixJ family response regulator
LRDGGALAFSAKALGIVDNDRFALQAMSGFLSKVLSPSFSITWLSDDPERSITRCTDGSVDVLLVDMSLGDVGGVQVIRAIRQRNANVGLIATTSFPLREYASEAAEAGAQGIISKNDLSGMPRLVKLVVSGHTGDTYDGVVFESANVAFKRICQSNANVGMELSPRETDIIELCSQGNTTTEVSRVLGISEATVNTHLQRACGKLGARNRVHLISLWMRLSRAKH